LHRGISDVELGEAGLLKSDCVRAGHHVLENEVTGILGRAGALISGSFVDDDDAGTNDDSSRVVSNSASDSSRSDSLAPSGVAEKTRRMAARSAKRKERPPQLKPLLPPRELTLRNLLFSGDRFAAALDGTTLLKSASNDADTPLRIRVTSLCVHAANLID
jgi:hypothetical protein